jgi:hypothetical protein
MGVNALALRKWLRGGLLLLAALQTVVSVWQYAFPHSFFYDFPTVSLDRPYNEHLVPDIGGLGLALTVMLFMAAWTLDTKVVLLALSGYLVYAATHFAFHVAHLDDFALRDAFAVGTGLGIEVVLAVALLLIALRLRRAESRLRH